VHLLVREDLLSLTAFHSKGERELFRDLLSVAGVGPKVALAVLSGLDENEFLEVVRLGSVERLTRVPGIGRKIAERLLLELKDRLDKRHAGSADGLPGLPAGGVMDARREVLEALVALGYKGAQAEQELAKALSRWQSGGGEGQPAVDVWLRLVLQK
jgi:Holliday junction DNA helicase RuvA